MTLESFVNPVDLKRQVKVSMCTVNNNNNNNSNNNNNNNNNSGKKKKALTTAHLNHYGVTV